MKNEIVFFSEFFVKELLKILMVCKENNADSTSIRFFREDFLKIDLKIDGIDLPESDELEVQIKFIEKKSKIKKFKVIE